MKKEENDKKVHPIEAGMNKQSIRDKKDNAYDKSSGKEETNKTETTSNQVPAEINKDKRRNFK